MINRRLYLILGLVIFPFSFCSSISIAASTDGIHTLRFSTFSSIATKSVNAGYQVTGTLGQSIAGHDYKSTLYTLDGGFWNGYLLPVLNGDLNNDGRVNLVDVITGLHTLTGQSSAVTIEADINADGKINSAELIYIMRKQAQLIE